MDDVTNIRLVGQSKSLTQKEVEELIYFEGSDDDGLDSESDEDFESSERNVLDTILPYMETNSDDDAKVEGPDAEVEDPDAELNRLFEEFQKYERDNFNLNESSVGLPDLARATINPPSLSPSSNIAGASNLPSSDVGLTNIVIPNIPKSKPKKDIKIVNMKWTSNNFSSVPTDEVEFKGNCDIPSDLSELQFPVQFFKYFFTPDLIDHIVQQTNLYASTVNINQPANIKKEEIWRYIGICLLSSVIQCKNFRMYWNTKFGYAPVSEVMTCNRFEKIRQVLHFNDNSAQKKHGEPGFDRLFKVRPIIETLRVRFGRVPMSEMMAVDEQICATKAHSSLKVYMPKKPHKYGYKLFLLSGTDGFCYDFEVYTGQVGPTERGEKDIGASSNVVVRLTRKVPKNKGYKIYFDNYFTSVPLQLHLHKRGILSLGTVRRNRLPNCNLPEDRLINKEARGTMITKYSKIYNTNFFVTMWKDTKVVTLLSTFVGSEPVFSVKRYDRKTKSYQSIMCPASIMQYNKHMGSVDLIDSFIGRYHIILRSRKWYFRLFYHLVDLTIINAWLAYKKTTNSAMKLADFRLDVAESLCRIGIRTHLKKCGRPSKESSPQETENKKRKLQQAGPSKVVRYDFTDHWPESAKKNRCKNDGCKGFSTTKCSKCNVTLCFVPFKKNCFKDYHTIKT